MIAAPRVAPFLLLLQPGVLLELVSADCSPYAANCSAAIPCPWPLPTSLCRAQSGVALPIDSNVSVVCDVGCSPSACATVTMREAVARYQLQLRAAATSSTSQTSASRASLAAVSICAHMHSDELGPATPQDYALDVLADGTATVRYRCLSLPLCLSVSLSLCLISVAAVSLAFCFFVADVSLSLTSLPPPVSAPCTVPWLAWSHCCNLPRSPPGSFAVRRLSLSLSLSRSRSLSLSLSL